MEPILIALIVFAAFAAWLRMHLVRRERVDLQREVLRAIRQANDDYSDDV
jgi:hypothetical protein